MHLCEPIPGRQNAVACLFKREARGLHATPKACNHLPPPCSQQPSRRTHLMASLPESRVRGEELDRVRSLGPSVLTLREGGSAGVPQPRPSETVVFTSFITVGLVPPFLEFLRYVLSHYGIHLAHLVPNSIVILSTFAHPCEMFLGIPPQSAPLPLFLLPPPQRF